jgi:hypothetical protein
MNLLYLARLGRGTTSELAENFRYIKEYLKKKHVFVQLMVVRIV